MRLLPTLMTSCGILTLALTTDGLFNILLKENSGVAFAQVTPDESLPNNSVVNDELEVTGGTTAGNNLFHSFSEFSVNTGETVFFNNNSAIANIISRVTGGNVSNIDGLLRANGSANLFLINPNGIVFGANSALDIGGSFISSTADSIQFADGTEFDAVNPDASPLLTVSIPVGLQYGNNAGDITVEGSGNNLNIDPDTLAVNRSDRPVGLEVKTGNTLALLGGDVFLPGGNLTVAEGRVVLGSVDSNSLVSLSSDDLGWSFNYDGVNSFSNIGLSQAASIEVSGNSGGEARLRGKEISLVDGSAILADTLGDGAGRVVELSATESITLLGFAADNFFPTRISTDVDIDATADGGNLSLNTNSLFIADGAQANSVTFGLGDGGNIQVNANEIEVLGESDDGEFVSGLFVQSDVGETGNGGNLTIDTNFLLVGEGADISSTAFGTGNAGNLDITANTIELEGFSNTSLIRSGLSATTEGAGNGGNLFIETDSLFVGGGADISTTTFDSGDAGNLNIKANTIELSGGAGGIGPSGLYANVEIDALGNGGNLNIDTNSLTIADGAQIVALTNSMSDAGTINIESQTIDLIGASPSGVPSGIFATTRFDGNGGNIAIATDTLEITDGAQIATSTTSLGNGGNVGITANDSIMLRGSSDIASSGIFATALESDGAGGNLTLETGFLSLIDGATISVSNFPSNDNSSLNPGSGAAGDVDIIADRILLAQQAAISAETFSGDLGNLNFQTDLLILRENSNITTNALEDATGGNININAEDGFVVAFPEENSDITANAVFGDGGRVDIDALEIIGIQPRLDVSRFSDITASSEFGIAGSVTLNRQDLNPTENLSELPNTFNPPQLTQGCNVATADSSSFVNLERGGLNPQSNAALGGTDTLLSDVRLPPQWQENQAQASVPKNTIVEAQGWVLNELGNVVLVANSHTESSSQCEQANS